MSMFPPSGPPSPTGSTSSVGSGKRVRTNDDDKDTDFPDHKKPGRIPKVTLNSIMDAVNTIGKTQTVHSTLLATLPELTAKLDSYAKDVEELKTTTARLHNENVEIKQVLSSLSERVDGVTSSTSALFVSPRSSADLSIVTAATKLHAAALQRLSGQISSISEIVITSFPDGDHLNDPLALANAVLTPLQPGLHPGDLLSARFLRKGTAANSNDLSTSATMLNPELSIAATTSTSTSTDRRSRTSIVVCCANSAVVQRIISSKRKLGILKLSMIDKSSPALSSWPHQFLQGDFSININELLPSKTYKLLIKAKAVLKLAGFKFVWSKNGAVYTKWDIGSITHPLSALEDIDQLVALYADKKNKN